jgi:hypothetical protein
MVVLPSHCAWGWPSTAKVHVRLGQGPAHQWWATVCSGDLTCAAVVAAIGGPARLGLHGGLHQARQADLTVVDDGYGAWNSYDGGGGSVGALW